MTWSVMAGTVMPSRPQVAVIRSGGDPERARPDDPWREDPWPADGRGRHAGPGALGARRAKKRSTNPGRDDLCLTSLLR